MLLYVEEYQRKKIILNHALPNALLPIVTISGLTMASLAGGTLLFEVTFSWPGIALRLHEAIFSKRLYLGARNCNFLPLCL